MRVLIIRPEPGNAVTAAKVAAIGFEAVAVPLFVVAPVDWDAPDPAGFDAVVMTSANAARFGGEALARYRNLPVFAVGEATAEAARKVGFSKVYVGTDDAEALGKILDEPLPFRGGVEVGAVPDSEAPVLADSPHPNPSPEGEGLKVLHLAGGAFRPIPTVAKVTVVPVYETRLLTPVHPLDADIALIHSPRAGERLAALVPDKSHMAIIAISPAAALACGADWAAIHVAAAPREDDMLECLARLCEAGRRSPESLSRMTNDPYLPEERRAHPLRNALLIALVAFVLGVALVTWAFTRWEPARRLIVPATVSQAPPVEGVIAPPLNVAQPPAATAATLSSEVAVTESRVAGLEARLAQIDTQADAASANAARAEGLLIAFAARRAVERGGSLGYLEAQLRTRFAATQPRAVAAIITATQSPVTLGGLRQQLDHIEPQLVGPSPTESWDAALRRTVGTLFIVRKADAPSPAADQRYDRARVALNGGQVDAALAEIARLPGRAVATDWMAAARRYIEAQRALDILEAAALTVAPSTIAGPVQ